MVESKKTALKQGAQVRTRPPAAAPEFQPAISTFENNVLPDRMGNTVISGGLRAPFYFYLGPNNTVPFVRLESAGSQKELSWGELVEVSPGASVQIRNVSYMPGDLQIQSGRHPCHAPGRITIPIQCDVTSIAEGNTLKLTPKFPCDTRRAVRAFFCYSVDVGDGAVSECKLEVEAFFKQHSGNPVSETQHAYLDRYTFNSASNPSVPIPDVVPLGTSISGNGMRLADVAFPTVYISSTSVTIAPRLADSFYVLEY